MLFAEKTINVTFLHSEEERSVACLTALAMASTNYQQRLLLEIRKCRADQSSPTAKRCRKWQLFKGLNRCHHHRCVRAIPVSKQYKRGVATKYCSGTSTTDTRNLKSMHHIIYQQRLYCTYVTPYLGRSPRRCHQHHAPLQRSIPGLYDCSR